MIYPCMCNRCIMHKKELRKKLLQSRELLAEDYRAEAGKAICQKVLSMPSFVNSKCVLCYVSFRSEVDTREILGFCFSSGKTVYCPKVLGPHEMAFYRVQDWKDLEPGAYGILEPKDCSLDNRFQDTDAEKACILVPGAGFDYEGYRIGYGGGYYDAYLCSHPIGCRIGLCYGTQMVLELETEPTDQKVDYVITEKEVYKSV